MNKLFVITSYKRKFKKKPKLCEKSSLTLYQKLIPDMNQSALCFGSDSTVSATQEEELSVKCDLEKEKKAKVRAFSAHSTFILSHWRTQM